MTRAETAPTPAGPPRWRVINPGDVLDSKYRVDDVLGVGGMGMVVSATHLVLRQQVALKVLHPWRLEGGLTVERFLREAQLAMRLRSEHVVRVSDLGLLPDGAPYMVMELLDGADLERTVAQRGPLPVDEAVDHVLQACEALEEAHSLGIVHRDLKPANLFLTHRHDGSALIKVLDFGIAKSTGSPASTLTATRCMLGSPRYAAPEQIRDARQVDARADIWSLGLVLYELLSGGKSPFDADTVEGVLARIVADPPVPLRTIVPQVPPAIEAVLMECLAKEPADRPPTVRALARSLARAAGVSPRLRSVLVTPPVAVRAPSLHDALAAAQSPAPTLADEAACTSRQRAWMAETLEAPLSRPSAAEPRATAPSVPALPAGEAPAPERPSDADAPPALASSVTARPPTAEPPPGSRPRRLPLSFAAAALLVAAAWLVLPARGERAAHDRQATASEPAAAAPSAAQLLAQTPPPALDAAEPPQPAPTMSAATTPAARTAAAQPTPEKRAPGSPTHAAAPRADDRAADRPPQGIPRGFKGAIESRH